MNYPNVTPGLIADATIFRYKKKYRDDNLYYIEDINDGKQSLFLREFSGIGDSMQFEFVEIDYDIFMSNDVVCLKRPPKKFKIGDRVKQIKPGKGTNSSDNGKESVVTWVNLNYCGKDGISIDGAGFHYQQFIRCSEAFELVTEPKKEGKDVTTKEVAQSQPKEPVMHQPVFKAGDRVRCITKNFAAQVGECGIVKKYDPLDCTIYVCVDGDTDSYWVKAQYWEIDSASPEPEENVLLLMLH